MEFIEIIENEKKKYQQMLSNYRNICSKYPDKKLFERKMNGKTRYYYKIQGDCRKHYIGWSQPELLRGLMEKKNALEKIPLLEENLKKLEALLDGYHSMEEIFPVKPLPPGSRPPAQQKSYRPSENAAFKKMLKHDTGLGFCTNSKSEAIIATRYHAFGIPFQYERRIRLQTADGQWKNMFPDFTIYGRETEFYHEHFGMFHKAKYRADNMNRLAVYHQNELLLGRDLFVTMDGPDESLDVGAIDQFIIHTILPLCTGAADSGIEKVF